jgi:transcription initiation factor TFIIB
VAASTIVPTSRNRIARYSRELVDAYEAEHGTDDPGVGLEEERDTLR